MPEVRKKRVLRVAGGDARLLTEWLALDGHEVTEADGAAHALALAAREQFDLIVVNDGSAGEAALLASEERNRAVLNAIPDKIFLLTADGIYLDYHAKDPEQLWAPPEQFLRKNVRDVLPPALAADFLGCFEQALASGSPVLHRYTLPAPDGPHTYEATVVGCGDDKVLSIVRDVTERRRAEDAVRESEKRFRATFEQAAVGVAHVSLDGRLLLMNQKLCDIVGYAREELFRKTYLDVTHPEDLDAEQEYARRLLAGEIESCALEKRYVRKDGSHVWAHLTVSLVRDEKTGEPSYFVAVVEDIGARKQAEESLKGALAEVRRLKDRLQEENIYLREEIKREGKLTEIVGRSGALRNVLDQVERVAPTDTTVLIMGETGTGKELVARAIHGAGLRRTRPLVKVNCAALSAGLIESELFGHEKGAFTGSAGRKVGRFELADGATIFLDEIGELPVELQPKLLRVLQEGEFERLGGNRTLRVDVRVIAATNRNLWKDVQAGRFREDLWYRLNIFPVTVPPLRQRREDISPLVEHFVAAFSGKMGRKITSVAPATLDALHDYSWPGNVRELANVIERAVITSAGPVLHISNIAEAFPAETAPTPNKTLEEMEREYIIAVLDSTGWRAEGRDGAARILGLHPNTLRTRMTKLNIQKP